MEPGHEIGDHGVQRHAVAGDQDAGLPRGAERGFQPALLHLRSMASEVYILPTEQSVPTARQRLPVRFTPLAIGYFTSGTRTSWSFRPVARATAARSFVAQEVVQPAGEVEPFLQRRDQHLLPRRRDDAAPVRDTDHQRLRARRLRPRRGPCRGASHRPCSPPSGTGPRHCRAASRECLARLSRQAGRARRREKGDTASGSSRPHAGERIRPQTIASHAPCFGKGCIRWANPSEIRAAKDATAQETCGARTLSLASAGAQAPGWCARNRSAPIPWRACCA
jgi:hypothetical protein